MYEKKNNDPLGEKNGGYYDLDSVKTRGQNQPLWIRPRPTCVRHLTRSIDLMDKTSSGI